MKRNIIIAFLAIVALSFSACKERGLDTNQYGDKVSLNAFGPCPVLRGDTIIVMGAHMDQVSQVLFPIANEDVPGYEAIERSKFIASSKPAEEFYIKVPENAISSKLGLVAGKDTIWSVSVVSYVEAVEVSGIKPEAPVTAGDIVTIEGDFMWNITSVTFYGGATVEAADFVKVGRKYIQVVVPIEAVSGKVTLLAGEDEFEAGVLEIHTPIINKTGEIMNVEYGDEIIITGEYLQFITTVNYPGVPDVAFEVNNEGTAIKTNVPMTSLGGAITLANNNTGATFSADTIAVPLVVVDSLSGKTSDLYPGNIITIHGKLFDRVEYLQLPNGDILKNIKFAQQQYEVNEDGTIITFAVREGQGDGGIILFQHDNNQPKTAGLSMHKEGNVFYTFATPWDVGSWDNNLELFTDKNPDVYEAFVKTITGPGKLVINHETNADDYRNFKAQWRDWSTPIDYNNPDDPHFDVEPGQKYTVVNVKAEDVTALIETGWVIYGHGIKILSFEWEALDGPKTAWEGTKELTGWAGWEFGKGDGEVLDIFKQLGVKEGSVITFYCDFLADDWAIKFYDGHWGVFNADQLGYEIVRPDDAGVINIENATTAKEDGFIAMTVDADVAARLTGDAYIDWGAGFIFQGNNISVKKITVKK